MKKLIISLAVIFMAVSTEVNAQIKYTPSPTSKISKEWFDKFLIKHQDSVRVIADFYPKNDYDYQLPLLVLHKNKQVEIILYNIGDSSYVITSPRLSDINFDGTRIPADCSSYIKNKGKLLTHKVLIAAIVGPIHPTD